MDPVDLSPLRTRFPALARVQDGRPVAFLDAPGGSQVPDTVIEAIASYLRTSNANAHGAFATSRETDAVVEEAHRAAADLLGCEPEEAIFGPNATTLLFAISRSIARTLGPGDEVVVTRLDHDANVRPWLLAAEDAGATVRWVDVRGEDITLDPDALEGALSDRTRIVAFTLASNAVGTVTPAADLIGVVKERTGALVVCDAVHFAQHRRIDVGALGCDLLACSPYKIFGPHLGILFGRREVLEGLRPYKVRPAEDQPPFRWETGTQNHEGMAGFVAAVDYLAEVGRTFGSPTREARGAALDEAYGAIAAHEAQLARVFLDGIGSVPGLRLYGISDPGRVLERTPTFAVRLGDRHPAEISKTLGEGGIFTWDGNYYAVELMERLGLEDEGGAVRIGFCHYNTEGEVHRVLGALIDIA